MEMALSERGLLQRGMDFFFPPKVSDLPGLRQFVAGEAAYLAQKSVIGYCRVKTLLAFEKLMKETIFRELLEICRWEAYSLTLADTLIVAEGCLRPGDAGQRAAVAEGLRLLYADILNEAVPAHRPQGWADRIAEFDQRFALSSQAAPQPPEQVIRATASTIHELAPIHTKLKRNDLEVIAGDLGFNMVALRTSMGKRFQLADLAAALAARRSN
ncbi:hypothetical protein [Ferrovibrio sp.]|uniref:hypothetical protein n=1 Tax=Ferrovibrio sp. TaxID=1917215 RepID=UPI001B794953|nr:hypothetical protein [Ferrovibrio sp.]MBP7063764.1 hypothetical protein [Ferrovibrio sp.]